ncbi:MAG TPA: thioredoxin-dependent thiol peroxidase [Myxococcaceae bacterium]|nr:thioredoxin-dependent thiol peroxidase [Myxococcaceae bacterium]
MTMPKVGAKAPDIALPDQSGETRTLDAYAGKYVVLYFYPKDDTPGCTVEACSFRDEHSALQSEDAVVLGVSPDSTARHQRFAEKYSLPFPLLADTGNKVATDYGVWTLKKNYGREYMGIQRSTFLIGPDGNVLKVWEKVKTKGHATEVLEALQAIKGGTVPSAPSRVKDAAQRAKDSATGKSTATRGAKSVKTDPALSRRSLSPADVESPRMEALAPAKTLSTKKKEKSVNEPKAAKAQDAEKSKAAKAKAAEKAKALKEKAKAAKAKAAEKAAKAKEKAKLAKAKAAEKAAKAKERARIQKEKEKARALKAKEKERAQKAKEKERALKAKEKAKAAKVAEKVAAAKEKSKAAPKARPAKISKVAAAAAPIAAKVAKAPKAPKAGKAKAAPKAKSAKAPKSKAARAS